MGMVDSRRVVETLCKHDPTFVQFASHYIGTTDPELIWKSIYSPNGFAKADPDQSDTHEQKPLGTPTVKPPEAPKPPKPVQAVKPPTQKKGALKPTKAMAPQKPPSPKKGKTGKAPQAQRGGPPKPKESSRTFGKALPTKAERTKAYQKGLKTGKAVGRGTLIATGVGATAYGAKKVRDWTKEKATGVKMVPGHATDYQETAKSEFSIIKYDDDKRQVFGWASVIEKNGQPVLDKQGDIIDPDEMEKSAYKFVLESRKGGHQHKRDMYDEPLKVSDMIESFALTDEKKKAMDLPPESPTGWWVGFKVNNDDTWDAVKSGKVTSFSIHGRGRRVPMDE